MELRINGQPRTEPIPGRLPKLRIYINIEGRKSQANEGPAFLLDIIPSFNLLGITVPQVIEEAGLRTGEDISVIGGYEQRYLLVMPRDLVDQIEASRANDVTVSVSLQARYFPTAQVGPNVAQMSRPSVFGVGHAFEISESKWLDLLDKMGYFSSWLLEVPRPRIEGWNEAVAFLRKAEERILSHDPEGAIGQCRAAWKSVESILDTNWLDIAAEIDRGSKKEEGEPEKSERVRNLWKNTLKFAHTGSHPESYAATMNDATFAYQLTCSVLSYLARKYTDSERRKPA